MNDDEFGDEDTDDIEDEIAWLLRPQWLHPDCRNACAALELGTCCKYPDNPLVRVAVDLAESVDRTLGRFGAVASAPSSPAAQVRTAQVRTAQVRTAQVGTAQVGTARDRPPSSPGCSAPSLGCSRRCTRYCPG